MFLAEQVAQLILIFLLISNLYLKTILLSAYKINLMANIFPGVLGMVCSSPCESSCRHGRNGNGESVNICHAKKSSFDYSDKKFIKIPLFLKVQKKMLLL